MNDDSLMRQELPEPTEATGDFTPDKVLESSEPRPTDDLRGTLSSGGEPFDPSIHVSPPKENKAGTWRRRPGRHAGAGVSAFDTDEPNAAYRKEAERMAGLYANSLGWLLGPEAAPKKKSDYQIISDAWFDYMIERGMIKISPVPMLVLSHVTYTSEILTRPTPAQRAKQIAFNLWMATPMGKRWYKKQQAEMARREASKEAEGATKQ